MSPTAPDKTAIIEQIEARWAACEGLLSARDTEPESDTDIEYRGATGKWTLASFHDTDLPVVNAWMIAFLRAKEDVQTLLAELDTLRPREKTAPVPKPKPILGPWVSDGGCNPDVWRRFDQSGAQRMCSGYLGWSVHTPAGVCFADGPEKGRAGCDSADRAARKIWDLDPGIPWRKLPDVCPKDDLGIHCRIPHPSGMYECACCGEVGA